MILVESLWVVFRFFMGMILLCGSSVFFAWILVWTISVMFCHEFFFSFSFWTCFKVKLYFWKKKKKWILLNSFLYWQCYDSCVNYSSIKTNLIRGAYGLFELIYLNLFADVSICETGRKSLFLIFFYFYDKW